MILPWRFAGENGPVAEAIIRTAGLTMVYRGTDLKAIDGLDLRIRLGEIFGPIGPVGRSNAQKIPADF